MSELDPRDDEISGFAALGGSGISASSRPRTFTLPPPRRARTLTRLELRSVPPDCGIYAAWLKDESALAMAGIDGPAPRLLYVGKAVGGLRRRLARHVDGGLPGIPGILAARGIVLFAFGDWYLPNLTTRTVPATPLTEIARRQVREWQQRYVHWAWRVCSRDQVVVAERELIRRYDPLLNTQFSTSGRIYLRASTGAVQARTRWLWHASWAGLILRARPFRSLDDDEKWREATIDEFGFPAPLSGAVADVGDAMLPIPPARKLRKPMKSAAASADVAIRDALGQSRAAAELEAWWAAHAGAVYLPTPSSIEEAIAASLRLEPETVAPCPVTFPISPERVDELFRLADTLDGVTD